MAGGDEGSIIAGGNPLHEAIGLFLLQLIIIIIVSRSLGLLLSYVRQPSVIAEVLGGIILGPTVLSRIDAFKNNIFPDESLPKLKLVAEIGLLLYLFLVGIELDPDLVLKNLRKSAVISLSGIVLPFSLGIAISILIYNEYLKDTVKQATFMIFCGTAMSITAFPILARILTELHLLHTTVGQITIAAAGIDDIIAWSLLAFVIALINQPDNSIVALYIFLVVIGYVVFLWFVIKPTFLYLVKKSNHENGASQSNVVIVLFTMAVSSWFTQAIGVHTIFGAFLIGLMVPHEKGFAIALTEKVEDLVSILFVPIYFASAGLKTQLAQLSDAKSWGYVALVFLAACCGKIFGCSMASRLTGNSWRDSLSIGVFMNTQGLMQIIVLNIGLEAGLINDKIYAIFLIMALSTTLMTVPLITWIYPPKYQVYMVPGESELTLSEKTIPPESGTKKLLVCLLSTGAATPAINFTQLMFDSGLSFEVYALRLFSLGDRVSKVMRATETSNTLKHDTTINMFLTFGHLNHKNIRPLMATSSPKEFGNEIVEAATTVNSDFMIIPISTLVYPKGWGLLMLKCLSESSPCTFGVLVDRGFGSAETPRELDAFEPTSEVQQKKIVLLFSESEDSAEALKIVEILAASKSTAITILNTTKVADHLELSKFNNYPNIKIELVESGSVETLVKSQGMEAGDLFVIGNAQYSDKSADSFTLKFWLDNSCRGSVLIVKNGIGFNGSADKRQVP